MLLRCICVHVSHQTDGALVSLLTFLFMFGVVRDLPYIGDIYSKGFDTVSGPVLNLR